MREGIIAYAKKMVRNAQNADTCGREKLLIDFILSPMHDIMNELLQWQKVSITAYDAFISRR